MGVGRVRVIIVGAGPAGATLAYLLASRGHSVRLLERQLDFAREFRGEALTPSGVHALRDMGFSSLLESVPTIRPAMLELFNDRERILSLNFDEELFGEDSPLIVSQPHLLEAIIAAGAKYPEFQFERGATVKALLRRQGRVCGVQAQADKGEFEFEADLVIGADGRNSRVRKQAEFEVNEGQVGMDIVWCKLPLPASFEAVPRGQFYMGNGHLLVCYRAPDDRLQLGWVIMKGTWGALRSRGVESWVDEMANHVAPDLSSHLRANSARISHPFLLSTAAQCVRRWSQPGVLLIGDAAHTHSPVGAQGINVALRDSIVAANHLIRTLRAGGAEAELDAAAQRIESERIREVRTIQRMQAMPPRLVLAEGSWGERVRGLAKLLRFPVVQAIVGRAARPFAFGVTNVELTE